MKAKKMIYGISVLSMLTASVIGGTGNLYAQNDVQQQKLNQQNTIVADLSLRETQKDKQVQFKSNMGEKQAAEKKGKNMEFTNKLIDVICF